MKNNIIILNFTWFPFILSCYLWREYISIGFIDYFVGQLGMIFFMTMFRKLTKKKKTIIWRIIEHRKTRLQCASRKISNFPPCQICILSWIHLLFFIIWFVSKFVQDIWICFFLCKYLILIVSIITVYFNFTL